MVVIVHSMTGTGSRVMFNDTAYINDNVNIDRGNDLVVRASWYINEMFLQIIQRECDDN